MRSIKMYGSAALATLAVTAAFGATSASAANWDPANTTVAGSGNLTFRTNSTLSATCTLTISLRSTGNDLSTSTTPPKFDNCSSNLANPTVFTSSTNWTATATSTTSVDLVEAFTINIGGGLCVITSSQAIAGNTWSNTVHTLTYNSAVSFPLTEHGFCDGSTAGSWVGTIQFPTSTTIT
jgi:hypothetical protein